MDPGDRPTDPEMDGIVARLREAGLLTIGVDAKGKETWTLTPQASRWPVSSPWGTRRRIKNAILDAVEASTPTE